MGWWVMAQRKAGGGRDLGKQTAWDQNLPLTYRLCDPEQVPCPLCALGLMCLLCVGMTSKHM